MTAALPDEFLLDVAAGCAPEPLAVLIDSHLALNPESRIKLRQLEAIGGALLADVTPVAVGPDALERALARLGPQEQPANQPRGAAPSGADPLPAALRRYVPNGLVALPWRKRGWGLAEAPLACASPGPYEMSLLRMRPGGRIPRHGHRGPELILVLAGGFSDQHGHYGVGDVCYADETADHRPIADGEGECLCLAVTRGPVRFKGLLGLLLAPFMRPS